MRSPERYLRQPWIELLPKGRSGLRCASNLPLQHRLPRERQLAGMQRDRTSASHRYVHAQDTLGKGRRWTGTGCRLWSHDQMLEALQAMLHDLIGIDHSTLFLNQRREPITQGMACASWSKKYDFG